MASIQTVIALLQSALDEAQQLAAPIPEPIPIPSSGAFRDGIPMLSPAEMTFADEPCNPTVWGGTQGYTWEGGDSTDAAPGPTWIADMQRGPAHAKEPGWYLNDGDAAIQWEKIGGDWIDATGVKHGSAPFSQVTIPAIQPGSQPSQISVDATAVVAELLASQNYGIWLASGNGNTTRFASRFTFSGPTLQVKTSKGTVTLPCVRSIWLSSSLTASAAGDLTKPQTLPARQYLQIAGKSAFGLLWFDLSQISDVITATLQLWTVPDPKYVLGNSTLQLFRIWNPGDLSTLAPQVLGIANDYPLDIGLINHPAVQFHERYDDANYTKRALFLWGPNHSLQTGYVPAMGEPMLPGMNELRVQQNSSIKKIGDTGNSAENSLVQFVWSPWRANPEFFHAKPPKEMEEVYLRYLIRFWKTWKAQPSGGKLPGIDCRYAGYGTGFPGVLGMGAGNSGDPCTGLNGGSVRMNFGARPPATSPHADLQGVGASDCYSIDQTGNFGSLLMFGRNYLGLLRLGTLNCIEFHLKMNSVSDPTAKPRLLSSVTSDGSGIAIATLKAPDRSLKTWPIVSTSGLASPTGTKGAYNADGVVPTYINDSQFSYPIAKGITYVPGHLQSPTAPCAWACVPSVALPDGIVEGFVNGRFAGGAYDFRIRHSRFCLDGKTIQGADAAWGTVYQGGPKPPIGNGDVSLASFVVSDQYVGPPVLQ